MKKLDNLLLGLKLILSKELSPIREQIAALRVENQVLRDELKALRKGRGDTKAPTLTVGEIAAKYERLQ